MVGLPKKRCGHPEDTRFLRRPLDDRGKADGEGVCTAYARLTRLGLSMGEVAAEGISTIGLAGGAAWAAARFHQADFPSRNSFRPKSLRAWT